jgi:aminoglycoside 3-N-acetyltransferase
VTALSTAKKLVQRYAPRGVVTALRGARRRAQRTRYRVRQRIDPVTLDREEIARAFREVGLREGDGVFVHSAMSAFGEIQGGPPTVIAALEQVVGSSGLISMPAFPLTGSGIDHLAGNPVFDVRETPSRMGAITEHFRKLPGVARSDHPTHSVAARGPGAEELVAGHAEAETPFGEGTPFARMIERGLKQVWFGTGLPIFTLYHAYEALRPGGFPIAVFHPERLPARVVDARGQEREVTTLVHDPRYAGRKDETRARMKELLLEAGTLRRTELGRGEILALDLSDLIGEMERLLQAGVTIYSFDVREPVAS